MSEPISLVMCVGREYKLFALLDEYGRWGASKRIPVTNADLLGKIEFGKSRLFIAHPDAIVKVTDPQRTLLGLVIELCVQGYMSETRLLEDTTAFLDFDWENMKPQPGDEVPAPMLVVSCALSRLSSFNKEAYDMLVAKYKLKFLRGIVGWSYITRAEYVLPEGVTDVPDEHAHLLPFMEDGTITPVHVEYIE